jgi:hypothetical protein
VFLINKINNKIKKQNFNIYLNNIRMLPPEWDQQFKQDMIMEWYQVYINFIAIQKPLSIVASIYAMHH